MNVTEQVIEELKAAVTAIKTKFPDATDVRSSLNLNCDGLPFLHLCGERSGVHRYSIVYTSEGKTMQDAVLELESLLASLDPVAEIRDHAAKLGYTLVPKQSVESAPELREAMAV